MTPLETRCFSLEEVSERLSVSRTTLWRLVKSGELPVVQIGARVLVEASDLDSFIEARKTNGPASDRTVRRASAEDGGGDDRA